jgi:hypothetical protein
MNQPQLPAYLQNRQSRIVSDGAAEGIGASLPPHISIRGNEFTLVDANGNKQEVAEKYLDACFVDRSDVVCKQYYEEDYVDGSNEPPTCFSANGVAPSVEATKPQSATCAVCEWNRRGSDVSKISGKAIKACRDEKWTAVILPKYPAMIFQFRVTPGSFKAWKGYVDKFKGQQTDLSDVVTRLAFEKGKNGVLTFEAVSYIDQTLYEAREQAAIEKKTDLLVGRNDRPIPGTAAIVQQGREGMTDEQTARLEDRLQTGTLDGSRGLASQRPLSATTFGTASEATTSSPESGRRKRRTKAEIEADNAKLAMTNAAQPQGTQFGGGNAGPAPFRPAAPPATEQAPFGIATTAVAPDPAMKGMLDGIFGSTPRSAE